MQRSIVAAALAAGFCGLALPAIAGQVTVITSFPKELTTAYQKAFEAAHPGIKIEILNKNTTAAVAYIRELPEGQRPDVMWASAPDAFEVLASYQLLQKAPEVVNKSAPEKIGNYPLNDPKGMYYGQALAGYGISWNTRYIKAHKLAAPREWSDLTRPEYFGHVAISSPSRSGTTQLTVETILQGEGWDKGWSQLLQIMGNAAAVTDRSFAVPDGVNNGQYGIGIVIDFLALAGKYSGYPVDFTYPSMTAVVPANIALIAAQAADAEGNLYLGPNTEDTPAIVEATAFKGGIVKILDRARADGLDVPVIPMALTNLWGSYFSRIEQGGAMVRPFRRGLFNRVGLNVGAPVPPAQAQPEALQARVAGLLQA